MTGSPNSRRLVQDQGGRGREATAALRSEPRATSGCPPCHQAAPGPPRPLGLALAGGLVPGAILAVLPKCPACLAAYLALGTGLAVSASSAAIVRGGLMMVCLASVSCGAAIVARRVIRRRDRP